MVKLNGHSIERPPDTSWMIVGKLLVEELVKKDLSVSQLDLSKVEFGEMCAELQRCEGMTPGQTILGLTMATEMELKEKGLKDDFEVRVGRPSGSVKLSLLVVRRFDQEEG